MPKRIYNQNEMGEKYSKRCIRLYFNEQEYELLQERERVLGTSKGLLVRKVLFENSEQMIINARDLLAVFDDIGQLIEQSTKSIHSHMENSYLSGDKDLSCTSYSERFNKVLSDYTNQLEALESAIRLLMKKMKA